MFATAKRTLTKLIPLGYRRGKGTPPTTRNLASTIPTAMAALVVVAAVSGSTPDGSVWNDARTTAPTASSVAMALEDLLAQTCYLCSDCGDDGHQILNRRPPPDGGRLASHPHPCQENAGPCDTDPRRGGHPRCGVTDILVAGSSDVIQTLKASTPDQLTALLASNPHRLRINRSRNALQLIGCWNQVVASYSVNSIPALEALIS